MCTQGLCNSFTSLRLSAGGAARPVHLCPPRRVTAERESGFAAASPPCASFRKAETSVARGKHERGAWATHSTSADQSLAYTENSVIDSRDNRDDVTVEGSIPTEGEAVEPAAFAVVDVSTLSAKERRKLRQDARRRNMVSRQVERNPRKGTKKNRQSS